MNLPKLALLLLLLPLANTLGETGFFHTEKSNGIWWLRDPDGQPFLSLGVCVVNRTPDMLRGTQTSSYDEHFRRAGVTPEQWREATARRFADWGFNTLGAWSSSKFAAETHGGRLASVGLVDFGLDFVRHQGGGQAWMQGKFPDVFDPAFATFAKALAAEKCSPRRDDPWLIGWFLDNELKWGPDWRGPDELLTQFLNFPTETPGRRAAFDLLQKRHPAIATFNVAWKTSYADWESARRATAAIATPYANHHASLQNQNTERLGPETFLADCNAFLALLAERYFAITTTSIRATDPHHLILGCRFPIVVPASVRAAAARHCDVISINSYAPDPTGDICAYDETDRPILIGEYTFRGADAGLPNSNKGLPIVPTQNDRAECTATYLKKAFGHASVIGAHWFQYVDQPKEGRFDGENSNVGLVNIQDQPYLGLVEMFTRVNPELPTIHLSANP